MAEVSRKLGTRIYKLSPCHAFPLTDRYLKKSEHGIYCTFLILTKKWSRRTSRIISTRAYNWSKNHNTTTPLYKSKTTYYDILKVSPNATQSQIKTAYYKQSFLYHPDKNDGREDAARRFSQISEAYSVLGSIGLRKKYDRGILSLSDVQSAGRPSSKEPAESTLRSQNAHYQQRSRSFASRTVGGKPIFDFDAFYQAHYGEQLQREQEVRRWRAQLRQKEQEHYRKWKRGKITEIAVGALLALGGAILVSMRS